MHLINGIFCKGPYFLWPIYRMTGQLALDTSSAELPSSTWQNWLDSFFFFGGGVAEQNYDTVAHSIILSELNGNFTPFKCIWGFHPHPADSHIKTMLRTLSEYISSLPGRFGVCYTFSTSAHLQADAAATRWNAQLVHCLLFVSFDHKFVLASHWSFLLAFKPR